MDKFINILKQNWMHLAGGAIGAIAGYLYWSFIGCSSGTCPITSSPVMSVIWGTIMGALLFGLFKKETK